MFHMIKFDMKKASPFVSIDLSGGIRIRYHLMLLNPKGSGEILKEWRGNNWDKEKDEFSLTFKGKDLKFAPLSWQFDIFPNPNVPGERYHINLVIKQQGKTIFSKPYQDGISKPEVIVEDAVFIPNI